MNNSQLPDNCNVNYEADAISFINEYDKSAKISCDSHTGTLIKEIINNNFTCNEIECAIDALKLNKSPGIDSIPAELIKACKNSLAETITIALNYIIQHREFPETWASGIRSAVFKNGQRCQVNNFRGITILPIMEKIFEAAVYRRLSFVNEAFEEIDKHNGGFLHDSRTSDNLFVLNGLIEKQLLLGKSLLVCFVNFSKAFDVINRNILFYKLMNRGWKGRVIDTLRNLYNKSNFRVKRHGQLSPAIQNRTGVNQGGISSGLMFRKYLADLGEYLNNQYGIVISDEILVHLLWADDLILFSDTCEGMQNLLNGLEKFCSNNQMVVNETKTKMLCFGKQISSNVYFNKKLIEKDDHYKYLGNVVRSVRRCNQDIFSRNFTHLCDQSRKALFNLHKKIKCLGSLPPKIMFYMFDALVCPILTYGSDVWGFNKSCFDILDKVFLNHVRCTLHVKGTTCNDVVTGESGKFPPSVYCHINVLCYYHRLLIMQDNRVVKSVFKALHNLNDYGFNTWITRLCELADHYKIDYDKAASLSPKQFKLGCAETVKNNFINRWVSNINADQSTRMRTYASFKKDFMSERYLDLIPAVKHRIALTKLRTSSHNLEIERGRYVRPRVSPEQRLCSTCHVIDDEIHFVTKCRINACERKSFFQKMSFVDPNFTALDDKNKFVYLMQSQDQRTLRWLAKFLYNSFNIRNEIIYSSSWGIIYVWWLILYCIYHTIYLLFLGAMAWHRTGGKPLPEPMIMKFTGTYVSR